MDRSRALRRQPASQDANVQLNPVSTHEGVELLEQIIADTRG